MPIQTTPQEHLELVKTVIADWSGRPIGDIAHDTELDTLRDGARKTLGLMLRARFDHTYPDAFDEARFEAIWLQATVGTVSHCYWAVSLCFS